MKNFKTTILLTGFSLTVFFVKAQNTISNNQTFTSYSQQTMKELAQKDSINLTNQKPFYQNKRALYSSLWAYSSLNYLYADLMAFMDKDVHKLYETGVVEGLEITPGFLTGAALFMQIPIANVVLPHLIKNDKTLKWVQIVSGSLMTVIQGATLFIGKPTPYYAALSVLEITATSFITLDALKWKPLKKKQNLPLQF